MKTLRKPSIRELTKLTSGYVFGVDPKGKIRNVNFFKAV